MGQCCSLRRTLTRLTGWIRKVRPNPIAGISQPDGQLGQIEFPSIEEEETLEEQPEDAIPSDSVNLDEKNQIDSAIRSRSKEALLREFTQRDHVSVVRVLMEMELEEDLVFETAVFVCELVGEVNRQYLRRSGLLEKVSQELERRTRLAGSAVSAGVEAQRKRFAEIDAEVEKVIKVLIGQYADEELARKEYSDSTRDRYRHHAAWGRLSTTIAARREQEGRLHDLLGARTELLDAVLKESKCQFLDGLAIRLDHLRGAFFVQRAGRVQVGGGMKKVLIFLGGTGKGNRCLRNAAAKLILMLHSLGYTRLDIYLFADLEFDSGDERLGYGRDGECFTDFEEGGHRFMFSDVLRYCQVYPGNWSDLLTVAVGFGTGGDVLFFYLNHGEDGRVAQPSGGWISCEQFGRFLLLLGRRFSRALLFVHSCGSAEFLAGALMSAKIWSEYEGFDGAGEVYAYSFSQYPQPGQRFGFCSSTAFVGTNSQFNVLDLEGIRSVLWLVLYAPGVVGSMLVTQLPLWLNSLTNPNSPAYEARCFHFGSVVVGFSVGHFLGGFSPVIAGRIQNSLLPRRKVDAFRGEWVFSDGTKLAEENQKIARGLGLMRLEGLSARGTAEFQAWLDLPGLLEAKVTDAGLTVGKVLNEMPAGCWEAMRSWLLRVLGDPPLGDSLAWHCWILPTYLASQREVGAPDDVVLEKAQELVKSLVPSVFSERAV